MPSIDAATITVEYRIGWGFHLISRGIRALRIFGYVPSAYSPLGTLLVRTLFVRQPGGTWRRITDKRALR